MMVGQERSGPMTRPDDVDGEPAQRSAAARRGLGTVDGSSSDRCAFCRRAMPEPAGVGRPRTYCRRSCRQRAFEQRRRATELSWGDERLMGLTEQVADYGDVLAGVRDVIAELRIDVADGVPV